jgi:cytochrome c oxidase subunit 3
VTVASVAERQSHGPTDERATPLGIGVVVWLASELMFFAGLFAAYFSLKSHNEPIWPPDDVHFELVRSGIFTAVLISSSFTMHFAIKAADERRRTASLVLLLTTIVLGGLFLTNQLLEYAALDFSIDTHAYGTIFYTLTGFHGLHVAGGLVALSMIAWVVFSRHSRIPSAHTLRVAGYYWHFVDVVWIAVFAGVYLLQ